MSRKTKKTISQYKANIKDFMNYAPALKRFKRRKTLKTGEKAFITKIANKIRRLSSPTTSLISLSRKEINFIKKNANKHAIIGDGVQAMSFRKLDKNAEARIINHEMRILSKGRDWHHLPITNIGIASFIDTARSLFREANSEPSIRQRTVALWSANGGNYRGYTALNGKQELAARIREYFTQYEEQNDWLLGLAYYDE